MSENRILTERELIYLEQLRDEALFDEAEDFLLSLPRTQEVMAQLRKVAIARVLFAAQGADAQSVNAALERYKEQLRAYQAQVDQHNK